MNVLGGFFSRLRGQISELGEAIAGSQLLRALDEEIRATDEQVREWRRVADVLKAQRFSAQDRLDAAAAKLLQRETQALAALQAGRKKLAREVAVAIVELEQARDEEQSLVGQTDVRMADLQHLIERGENALRRLKHRVDLVRAAETVARAEEAFASRSDGTAMHIPTAVESAELLRQRSARQTEPKATSAMVPSVDDSLDAKLEAAGLASPTSPVDVVIERLSLQMHSTKPARRRKPDDQSQGVS